jgi:adenine-specific DNA-methyltransferase
MNRIIHGDCLDVLRGMDDNSVDMVLTDPPYNIGKSFLNDNLSLDDYLTWCEEWIKECCRVLRFGGAFWMTLGWQTVAEVKLIVSAQDNMRLKNWVVWYRQDGWKGDKGFSQSHEHVLFYIKDNLTPELHQGFIDYLNEKRALKGVKQSDINKHFGWATTGGGVSSSYMGNKKDNLLPTRSHYELLKEYLALDGRYDNLPFGVKFNKCDVSDDVWLKPKSEKDRWGHPTQKPTALFRRIITVSSDEGDLILDPFLGSGTTARACKDLNRNYIGIEIDADYVAIAEKRIMQEVLL